MSIKMKLNYSFIIQKLSLSREWSISAFQYHMNPLLFLKFFPYVMGCAVWILRFRINSKTMEVSGIWRVFLESGSAHCEFRSYVGVRGSACMYYGGLESVIPVLEVCSTRGIVAVIA